MPVRLELVKPQNLSFMTLSSFQDIWNRWSGHLDLQSLSVPDQPWSRPLASVYYDWSSDQQLASASSSTLVSRACASSWLCEMVMSPAKSRSDTATSGADVRDHVDWWWSHGSHLVWHISKRSARLIFPLMCTGPLNTYTWYFYILF